MSGRPPEVGDGLGVPLGLRPGRAPDGDGVGVGDGVARAATICDRDKA
jgi:hypothetical protein